MVGRSARRQRKDPSGTVFGVAGGFDLAAGAAIADCGDELAVLDCSMPWYASHFWSPANHPGRPGTPCWRQSVSSRRSSWSVGAKPTARAMRTPTTSRRAKTSAGPVGQPAPTRELGVARSRAAESACRVPLEHRRRQPGDRRDDRFLRLTTRPVFYTLEPVSWAEELIELAGPPITGAWCSYLPWPRSLRRRPRR